MPTRKAEAEWEGNLAQGSGTLKVGSGAFEGPYSFKSRFEEGEAATNPEELLGAAHAGCFTMALTAALSRASIKPKRIHTEARVKLEKVGEALLSHRSSLRLRLRFLISMMRRFNNMRRARKKTVRCRRHSRVRRLV